MSLILSSTTDRVEVVTSSDATLDYTTQWVEADKSSAPAKVTNADTKVGTIAAVATTNISGSPPSASKRWAVTTNISNVDPSESNDITLQYVKAGGAPSILITVRLYAGWSLRLDSDSEIGVYDELGVLQVAAPLGLTNAELRATPVAVSAGSLPLPAGAATNATLAAVGAVLAAATTDLDEIATDTDKLDVNLSTRATEATLAEIATDTDKLDVNLSTRATESTLAEIALDTDKLDVNLSTRATEATLAEIATDTDNLAGIKTGTDFLAEIATDTDNLAGIKAGTDKIPAQGQALAAGSTPVVLTAIQVAALTPPAAITGFALESGGNLDSIKTDLDDIAADTEVLGAATDAGVSTDVNGTVSAKLRGLIILIVNFLSRLPDALGAGGGLKVDGSGTPLPVSGTVTAASAHGALIDASDEIDAAATSQQVVAGRAARKYFLFVNVSDTDMWIDFGVAAVADSPSILVKANGGSFVMEGSFISTDAINVLCATIGKTFAAKEA